MAKKIREEGEKRVKKQGDEIFTCPFLSPLDTRSEDISESRLLMESGMFFRMDGG